MFSTSEYSQFSAMKSNVIIVLCGKMCLFLNIYACIYICFAVKERACPCEKVRYVERSKQFPNWSTAAKEFEIPVSTINDWRKKYDINKKLSGKHKCVNNELCCVNASSVSSIL